MVRSLEQWMVRRALLLFISLSVCFLPASAEVIDIGNAELAVLLEQGVPIIDIRTPLEWSHTGIVKGSHLITFFDHYGRYNIPSWLAEVRKIVGPEDPVILICRTGSRTASVSGLLGIREEYSKVYNVREGIVKWIAEKRPVVQPGATR
jgi:rhodanese-related sulfurtransferase